MRRARISGGGWTWTAMGEREEVPAYGARIKLTSSIGKREDDARHCLSKFRLSQRNSFAYSFSLGSLPSFMACDDTQAPPFKSKVLEEQKTKQA